MEGPIDVEKQVTDPPASSEQRIMSSDKHHRNVQRVELDHEMNDSVNVTCYFSLSFFLSRSL